MSLPLVLGSMAHTVTLSSAALSSCKVPSVMSWCPSVGRLPKCAEQKRFACPKSSEVLNNLNIISEWWSWTWGLFIVIAKERRNQ